MDPPIAVAGTSIPSAKILSYLILTSDYMVATVVRVLL